MDVREGTTTWLKAKVPVNERVLYFQALDGDAILGRGSQTSSAGRRQHLASGLPSGLGAGLVGTMGTIEGYILGPSPLPRQHLEPGPPSARLGPTLLTSCLGLAVVSASLIAQLTAPGHPRPVPHHLQPGLCQELTGAASKHPWAPAEGSAPVTRALPRASRKERAPALQLGAGAGGEVRREGRTLFCADVPRYPLFSHLFLVSTSGVWPPRGVGSLPTPLSPLPLLFSRISAFGSLPAGPPEVRAGVWKEPGAQGRGGDGRRGRGEAISFPELFLSIQVVA